MNDESAPTEQPPSEATDEAGPVPAVDRSLVIGSGLRWCTAWALRLMVLGLALWLAKELLGRLWVGVLPLIMALLISSVLWPLVRLLTRHRVPPAVAAALAVLLSLGAFVGITALAVPQMVEQAPQIADRASAGIRQVQGWLQKPPFNLQDEQINEALLTVQEKVQSSGDAIAAGAFTGVSAVTSFFVNIFLVLILCFLMLKDGPRFLPMMRRLTGDTAGAHITEASTRIWHTLSGYLRTQALVSFIDAVLIGGGLAILGVPLAVPLALITFMAGFIPLVGAVAAGALAVLVALVTNGVTDALIVLAIVVAVQQLEGNVLSPMLQGKSMQLHPAVVLLAVAAGGSWFGITGAFLSVPVAATFAVVFRYANEQVNLVSGTSTADEIAHRTDLGRQSAARVEQISHLFRMPRRTSGEQSDAKASGSDGTAGADTSEESTPADPDAPSAPTKPAKPASARDDFDDAVDLKPRAGLVERLLGLRGRR